MERQSRSEGEAFRLISDGDETTAVGVLQQYVNENCQRIKSEYEMLNRTLPTMLETLGIEYLFTDYVKEWTVPKGVPLPLP
jgi:hypothetical protein